eukprot:GFUD01097531.1.p1 GENE.GFUD01097531.1~~GFUD01097531.1.p1  ORF type:complete len:128 (+),score=47.79 GFUD01097531.1:59-385(+)
MAARLFRENSAQRFCRESLEMWQKVKTEESLTINRRGNSITDGKQVDSKETANEPQPVRRIITKLPSNVVKEEQKTIPRKVQSKFVKTKPALKEKNTENSKIGSLKKK